MNRTFAEDFYQFIEAHKWIGKKYKLKSYPFKKIFVRKTKKLVMLRRYRKGKNIQVMGYVSSSIPK